MGLDNITIKNIAKILVENGNTLVPCSSFEVDKIEDTYKVSLPEVYKEFLLTMGKGAGKFMMGSSCFYNEIYDLYEGAIEIIDDNQLPPFPDNAFVFWMHQGYQFAFFLLNESHDPPVYFFSEGKKMVNYKQKNNTLSSFFYDQLKG